MLTINNIVIVGLTLMSFCIILIIMKKKEKKSFAKIVYRQSDMHNMLKDFFFKDIFNDNLVASQSKIWKEKQTTKVVIINEKAYWVSNNMFYVGDTVDGQVRPETGIPLDTSNMSKKEVDKMLFILDNLKNGNINDSGSTGNQ
jgi:archaellin